MTVLKQWNDVEAKFASEYGLSLHDIFSMTWRRFRVLFLGVFHWQDEEEDTELPGPGDWSIGRSVDWETARSQHVQVQDLSRPGITVNRLPVGGTNG